MYTTLESQDSSSTEKYLLSSSFLQLCWKLNLVKLKALWEPKKSQALLKHHEICRMANISTAKPYIIQKTRKMIKAFQVNYQYSLFPS